MKTSQTDKSTDVLRNEAHVWFITPESVCDPAVLQHCQDILDTNETEKLGRFVHAEDSHCYLVSHAMLRSVLSNYADVAPSDWCFSKGQHGRPEIVSDDQIRLRFNLTHTPGLAACIVTLDDDCGIDAEKLRDRHNPLGVAKRMFSAPELEQLMQREGQAFLEYFYEHWTLREAYVKARGIGISFPTREIQFSVEGQEVTVRFDDTIDDNEGDWRFQMIRPGSTHIAALALHDSANAGKHIRIQDFDFNN